ncbi:MAG: RtcB family protein [Polyangiaceae bacterium]|nr:RtcB family protein [Polyangiaceae bacterium]
MPRKGGTAERSEARRGQDRSEAYKDVEDVVDVIAGAGISRKVAKLVPLGVIKG